MKKFYAALPLFLALVAMSLTIGCSKPSESTKTPTTAATPADEHGHSHDAGGHGAGPHDGVVADWGGGKFHVEFTVDHDKQEATVYVLGGDEKTPAPIKSKEIQLTIKDPAMQVALQALPQASDPAGSASRFVGNDKGLGVVQEYEGTISGVVDDTPYSGDFKEETHDH